MLGKICCLIANKEIVNSVGEYQVANQCQSSLSWVFSWTVQNNLAPVLTYQTVNSTFWIPPPPKLYISDLFWYYLFPIISRINKSYSHIGCDTVNYEWLAVTIMSPDPKLCMMCICTIYIPVLWDSHYQIDHYPDTAHSIADPHRKRSSSGKKKIFKVGSRR